MIKNFEQFVNENYSSQNHATKDRELFDYLYSIGFDRDITTQILKESQKVDFYYTEEEAENIFKRLPNCETLEDKINFVMYNFFTSKYDENGIFTYDWCKENHCPVVRGIDGKLLTGEVYYCEELDKYAEYEDDIYSSKNGYEYLCTLAEEEGILDDDQPDWVDNHLDLLNVYEVNLDDEFGWKE